MSQVFIGSEAAGPGPSAGPGLCGPNIIISNFKFKMAGMDEFESKSLERYIEHKSRALVLCVTHGDDLFGICGAN